MEIVQATLDDVDNIIDDIYPIYFAESATYNFLTPDLDNTKLVVTEYVTGGNICFIAKDEGRIVALACANIMRTFYKEIECDVNMFFVAPSHRGNGLSRKLVETIVYQAEMNDAKIIYSSCFSGLGENNNNLYINLWKKYGFQVLGTVMIRGKNV